MNMSKKSHGVVFGGVIAALYAALTLSQEALLPGTATMAFQFRLSEAITMLSVFTPYAIPGLTVGCFIANFMSLGTLPIDVVMGSLATFLAAVCSYKTRNICYKGLPVLSATMPAVFNGVIIGAEIEIFFIDGPFNFLSFMTQGGLVALGEAAVCFTLGLLLVSTLKNKKIIKYLNNI